MQLVTFARDVAPFVAGEKRLVPDEVAEELLAEGNISDFVSWPPSDLENGQEPVIARRQVPRPQRQPQRDNRKVR